MSDPVARLNAALSDRYRIERELGVGGMATVYLARDLRHDRDVAIKVLRQDVAQAVGAERFLQEIRLAAGLSHPHILPVFDSGEAAGLLFYVMPNAEGQSVREQLDDGGPLPVTTAVRIAREVAEALDYAHRQGVVHRDIKPDNIMLHEGHAMVADFGIGKAVGAVEAQAFTQTGAAVGTPAYMSPEQAAGEAVDGRSDLYALGCVLYEMLVGEPPFTGPTVQVVIAKRFIQTPADVTALRDGVPRPVAQSVHKALARMPVDRFRTGTQFARALAELETPGPIAGAAAPSVAVLPFVNMSPDPDQEYFADGLSEELLNQLAQIKGLRVAARTSSFYFKGKDVDLNEVAAKLGVSHVLEGSVRKAGNQLRITAQLITTGDGYHLWSETYARTLDDVFAIQEGIAGAVAGALSVTLGVGVPEAAPGPTEDVEAYDLYLRARAPYNRRRPEDLARAAELFSQALARDPAFSRARAGLANTLLWERIYVPERWAEAERALAQTVAEARAQAPDDWATHMASAALHMQRGEWVDAEAALARTTALAPPSEPEVIELHARLLLHLGRVEAALDVLRVAALSDPLSTNTSFFVQYALYMLGRSGEGETEYRRSLELPGVDAREDIHHIALMRIWDGPDAALIERRFDAFLVRRTLSTTWCDKVRAVCHDRDAALSVIRAAYDDPDNGDPTRLGLLAAYAGHYGDQDLALAALRRSLVDFRGFSLVILWWRALARARRLAGFKDLVRDLGLVAYWRETGNWGDFARPVGEDDFECF
jgi:serine/threonine protein kinase/tetratricopeptide (TPR) repeat protein